MSDVESPVYVSGHGLLTGRSSPSSPPPRARASAGRRRAGSWRRGRGSSWVDAHVRRLKESEEALAAEFGAANVASLPCDVTDEQQVEALFALAGDLHDGLDIVVNNAGLGGTCALVDMTDEQ